MTKYEILVPFNTNLQFLQDATMSVLLGLDGFCYVLMTFVDFFTGLFIVDILAS